MITYDISNDRLRDQVAETLEGFGRRVQYSVFECRLDDRTFEHLTLRLQGLLTAAESANIRCYRLCEPCERSSFVLGDARPDDGAAVWV